MPNPEAQISLIKFQGGGIDFDKAFLLSYEKISSNPDFHKFDSHTIFFYTDGDVLSYPKQSIDKFNQLPIEKRQKIELFACSEESTPNILAKIVDYLSQRLGSAKLQTSIQPEKIALVWIQEVKRQNCFSQNQIL